MRGALAALSLSMLLSSLGISIANVGLPTLVQAFDASFQDVQWVVIAYLLAITTVVVSVGRLGDTIGRRRLMLAGIAVFTAASIVSGAAPTLRMLIAARAVQGIGAAIMMALALAFVSDAVSKEKTGSAMGLLGTMSAIGTALGPSFGGVLIAYVGWRAIFLINLPLGLIAIWLAYRCLPNDRAFELATANRPRFDAPGTLLLALTLAAYALTMTMGRGSFGPLNAALLLISVLGLVLFVLVEAKSVSPLIELSIFRNPVLSVGFVTNAMVTTVVMATLVVGPFYLAGALALDAAQVGLVMSSGPIVAALTGVPAGRSVDRYGAQRMAIAGLIGMAAGTALLAALPMTSGITGYVAPLALITAGYALFQAANNTAVMMGIRAGQRGVVSGMLNLSRNLGLVSGASAMSAVFAHAAGAVDIAAASAEAIATGMRMAFAVAVILVLFALAITLAGRMLAARLSRTSRDVGLLND